MGTIHELVGGKVQLYQRANSPYWWCAATTGGTRHRVSTKKESLAEAQAFAEDWLLELRGKNRWGGGVATGKTFKFAADRFLAEFEVLTVGERSPLYVQGHKDRVKNHLIPFFGDKPLPEITSGLIQDYRLHRLRTGNLKGGRKHKSDDPKAVARAEAKRKKRGVEGIVEERLRTPARSTLHQEMVCLRQILKSAHRHGWLTALPDMTVPYKASGKVRHRGWFSPEEYTALRTETADRAKNPLKERWRIASETLHDFVIFMVNTGLRPDEALRLEFRDIAIITDRATKKKILEIEVRGKRGVGYCKSMPGAVYAFQCIVERRKRLLKAETESVEGDADAQQATLDPTAKVFPVLQRELFNAVLKKLNMKTDREGQPRTFYSLRHTYICLRLMQGADIYQIAKNCRTSVEMIETYYASHLKNVLDTSTINIRKSKQYADLQEEYAL
ncbi:MAG: site-specific integrase [Brevundimonas sp.]|uniref:site-specific integrase n=1 Tax=Brevundimonas sp. TaxID=1871086 RepID=UPI001A1A9EF7|nr:site-specific integrase [Brevundimonas sp.]MBJ7318047.1 site-specific integrase [Brevundimonas sp.]